MMADSNSSETAVTPMPEPTQSKRESASRTAASLGESPLALVAGGVALGAIIGLLLPRLQRERDLLAPVGKRLAETTSSAARAARDTGKREIEALLPDTGQTKDRVGQLFSSVLTAAKDAAKTE